MLSPRRLYTCIIDTRARARTSCEFGELEVFFFGFHHGLIIQFRLTNYFRVLFIDILWGKTCLYLISARSRKKTFHKLTIYFKHPGLECSPSRICVCVYNRIASGHVQRVIPLKITLIKNVFFFSHQLYSYVHIVGFISIDVLGFLYGTCKSYRNTARRRITQNAITYT